MRGKLFIVRIEDFFFEWERRVRVRVRVRGLLFRGGVGGFWGTCASRKRSLNVMSSPGSFRYVTWWRFEVSSEPPLPPFTHIYDNNGHLDLYGLYIYGFYTEYVFRLAVTWIPASVSC